MIAYCKRAAIAHQTVNCLTEICFTEAIAEATRQDKVFAETGRVIGPLHGLPVSIKDHVDVAGKRSTLGYCSLAENRPEEDAVLVKALKAAGAIVFVKTTMPVTGMVFILPTYSDVVINSSRRLWRQQVISSAGPVVVLTAIWYLAVALAAKALLLECVDLQWVLEPT